MTTTTTNQFPTTTDSLETYRQAQREDPVCSQLMTFCQTQWPSKHNLPQELSKYWTARHHLTVCDKLLLYETRYPDDYNTKPFGRFIRVIRA